MTSGMKTEAFTHRVDVSASVTDLGRFVKLEAGSGYRFKKEVLRVWSGVDPNTRKPLSFDRAFLEKLAAATNRWIQLGHKVPAPDGHTDAAMANLGWWQSFALEGDKLVGVFEAADEVVASRIGTAIQDVSVYVRGPEQASSGEEFEAVIIHCCLTPTPVVPGQSNFVRLARTTEAPMTEIKASKKLEAAVKLLAGIPDDADEAAVIAALRSKFVGEHAGAPVDGEAEEDEEDEELAKKTAETATALARRIDTQAEEIKVLKLELSKTRLEKAQTKVSAAKRELSDAGLPLDGDLEKEIVTLLARGDDEGERLGGKLLEVTLGRAKDRPKAFATIPNPGVKTDKVDAEEETAYEAMLLSRNYTIEKCPKTGRVIKATPPSLAK